MKLKKLQQTCSEVALEDPAQVQILNGYVGPLAYAEKVAGGVPIKILLDTSSSVSLISETLLYDMARKQNLDVKAADVTIRDYTSSQIPVRAKVIVHLEVNG